MSEPTIPSSLTVDRSAIEGLASAGGVKDAPLLWETAEGCRGRTVLNREIWDRWVAAHGTVFKWPSFVDLFQAQNNDGNPDSLSAIDLQKQIAEIKFVKAHGYPEAIILGLFGKTFRMPDGSLWEERPAMGQIFITRMGRQGKEREIEIANDTLREMDEAFEAAGPEERLAMKRTMGSRRLTSVSSGGGSTVDFAGQEYVLGNSNSRIAYKSDSPVAKYYLAQPQNGCMAAAILNGGIFQGQLAKNPADLEGFYEKLKAMQGSIDGRIRVAELVEAISRGEIPGLTAKEVKPSKIKDLIEAKKPVMALVPYFNGHAFFIESVDAAKGTYKAVDTVTGMVVEETIAEASHGEVTADPDTKLEIRGTTLQGKSEPSTNRAEIANTIRQITNDPEFRRMMSAWTRQNFFPPPTPRAFYSIEITDPSAFLAWVRR